MIRRRSLSTHWRLAAALPLALALAGCGGGGSQSGVAGKTVHAEQWVGAVCSSIHRYDSATKQPLLVFQGLHLQFQYGEPKQGKVRDQQMAASEEIVKATDRLIADLNAAGAPDTPHGRQFAVAMVSAFQELRDSVNDVHSQAEALPAGSGRADASAELSPKIGAALQQWQSRANDDRKANGAGIDLNCSGS